MKTIRVLVGCECSQAITKEFRRLGVEAFSCDTEPAYGGHPEWHYQIDLLDLLGEDHHWDLAIFHPPCTYLSNSGVSWLYKKDGSRNEKRWEAMFDGAMFFYQLMNADIERIVIENPIMHKYAKDFIGCGQPTQVIQPYQFGDDASKATCLWIKNMPKLTQTEHIHPAVTTDGKKRWANQTPGGHNKLGPSKERAALRSKTYPGIAKAIAEQYTTYLKSLQ